MHTGIAYYNEFFSVKVEIAILISTTVKATPAKTVGTASIKSMGTNVFVPSDFLEASAR